MARLVKRSGIPIRVAVTQGIGSTRMYSSLDQLVRGWSRILYDALGRSSWRLLAKVLDPLIFSQSGHLALVASLVLLALGRSVPFALWLLGMSVALHVLTYVVLGRLYRLSVPRTLHVGWYPIANLVMDWILFRSIRSCLTGRVTWRGTAYGPTEVTRGRFRSRSQGVLGVSSGTDTYLIAGNPATGAELGRVHHASRGRGGSGRRARAVQEPWDRLCRVRKDLLSRWWRILARDAESWADQIRAGRSASPGRSTRGRRCSLLDAIRWTVKNAGEPSRRRRSAQAGALAARSLGTTSVESRSACRDDRDLEFSLPPQRPPIAQALAMGNAVVWKPSEPRAVGPSPSRGFTEAGFPPGLVSPSTAARRWGEPWWMPTSIRECSPVGSRTAGASSASSRARHSHSRNSGLRCGRRPSRRTARVDHQRSPGAVRGLRPGLRRGQANPGRRRSSSWAEALPQPRVPCGSATQVGSRSILVP